MDPAVPLRFHVMAEPFHGDRAHAGHDSHAEYDVFRIGDFEANLGERRVRRAHDVRDDEQRAPAHRSLQQSLQLRISLGRI